MLPVWVQSLLKLQQMDAEIDGIRVRLSAFPAECKRIAAEKNAADARVREAAGEIALQQNRIRMAEEEVRTLEEKRNRLKQQSALIKNNAEYQRLMAECAMLEHVIQEEETHLLLEMEKLPEAKRNLENVRLQAAQEIQALKKEYMEFAGAEKSFRNDLASAEARRAEAASRIERNLLDMYEDLRKDRRGVPLVAVRENGVCGNCSLKLTPHTLALAEAGKCVPCENCRHLIYLEKPEA